MRWLVSCAFALIVLTGPSVLAQLKIRHPKGAYLVKLWLNNGVQKTGIWIDASQTGIRIAKLHNLNQVNEVLPDSIYRFEVRKLNSVKRNTLIGAGTGLIIGFTIGWDEYKTGSGADVNQMGHAAGSALLGGFVGGFIGFISGTATQSYYVLGHADRYLTILPKLQRYKLPVLHED